MSQHRIGLVADTHVPEAGTDLPTEAYDVLAGCEQVLHAGDLHTLDIVDRLERVAPTLVSRGNGDRRIPRAGRPGVPDDPRVADTQVVDVGGLRIGVTHDLGHVEGHDDPGVRALLAKRFGGSVDVAVAGHSHVPMVWGLADGTAIVNPGSPTLPYGYRDVLGTVGLLEIDDDAFRITIVDLATGAPQLTLNGPAPHPFEVGPRPTRGR